MERYLLMFFVIVFFNQVSHSQNLDFSINKVQGSNEEDMSLLRDADANFFLLGNITLFPESNMDKYHSDGFGIWKFKMSGEKDALFGEEGYVYHHLNDSIVNVITATTITHNDEIIALANFKKMKGLNNTRVQYEGIHLFKFKKDGSFDSSFGDNGICTFDLGQKYNRQVYAKSIKILKDGKILFMASTGESIDGESSQLMIFRLLANGSLDPSFGENGILSENLEIELEQERGIGSMPINMIIDSKERILIANYYLKMSKDVKSSGRNVVIRRFLENGTKDISFGKEGDLKIYTLEKHFALVDFCLNKEGDLLLAGVYHSRNGQIDIFLTSLDMSQEINPVLEENKTVIFAIEENNRNMLKGIHLLKNNEMLLFGNMGKEVYVNSYSHLFFTKLQEDFTVVNEFGDNGTLTQAIEENQGATINRGIGDDSRFIFTGTTRPKEFNGNVDAFIIDLNLN